MAKKVNTTALGVFVVGAVALAVIAIGLFGSGQLFKKRDPYVIFFPESVLGLSVGGPVEFRGVPIGTVTKIEALYRKAEKKIIIPVYIDIDHDRIKNLVIEANTVEERQEALLNAGLRARLITESIVTGQRAVALDFRPDAPIRIVGADPSVPEISSVPSSLEQISTQLESLPVDQIAQNLNEALAAIGQVVNSPGFKEGVESIGPTLLEANKAMTAVSNDLQPLVKDLRTKIEAFDVQKLDRSLTAFDGAARNIELLTRQGAPLDRNTNRALVEIAGAARELRQFAELIQRRPEVLLAGKKR